MQFLRFIDIARERGYNIAELLSYELCPVSFYLTKDGFLKKPTKSLLNRELRSNLTALTLIIQEFNMAVIEFMAFARKVPIKILNVETYTDFAARLLKTFLSISNKASRVDILFDLYLPESPKGFERNRRSGNDVMDVVDMKKFWDSCLNKKKV